MFYFLGLLCVFGLTCFFAQSVYPSEYSLLVNNVSNLGSPAKNPTGAWFWNIMVVFMGITLIPVFFFLFRSFSIGKQTRILERCTLISGLVTCVGFIGAGCFSEDLGGIHVIFAVCTFFGLVFALNFFYGIIFWEWKFRHQWGFSLLFWGILFFPLNFIFLVTLFIPIVVDSLHLSPPIPPLFRFPLWEWILLINIFLCLLVIVLYAPHRPNKAVLST